MTFSDLLKKIFRRQPPPVLLFDEPFCKIYFHHTIQAVHLDWHGQATTQQFQEACEFSLNLLVARKARKMIADNSKVSTVSEENQYWLIENWFPRAIEEGFQYSAVILSNKEIVKSALQLIVSKISTNHVIVNNFYELDQAKKWLEKVR